MAQVIQESATQGFLAQRRRDQQRALQLLREDPGLRHAPAPARAPRAGAAAMPHRLHLLSAALGCARGGRELQLTEAPLVDLEVRGVPALQYFGNQVWQ